MRAILAYDDLLSRADTELALPNGDLGYFGLSDRAWLNDDLFNATAIPAGSIYWATPFVYRFRLATPQTVAVAAILNCLLSPGVSFSPADVFTGEIRLRDAALTSLGIGAFSFPTWTEAAASRDFVYVPSSPVASVKFIDFAFDGLPSGRLAFIGRVFAASGLVLTDVTEPRWSLATANELEAQPGITGGFRIVTGAPRRQLSVTLGGLTAAEAFGTSSFGAEHVPGIQQAQLAAGTSKPVLFALRGNSTAADVRDYTVFARFSSPPVIARDAVQDGRYRVGLQFSEAQR